MGTTLPASVHWGPCGTLGAHVNVLGTSGPPTSTVPSQTQGACRQYVPSSGGDMKMNAAYPFFCALHTAWLFVLGGWRYTCCKGERRTIDTRSDQWCNAGGHTPKTCPFTDAKVWWKARQNVLQLQERYRWHHCHHVQLGFRGREGRDTHICSRSKF